MSQDAGHPRRRGGRPQEAAQLERNESGRLQGSLPAAESPHHGGGSPAGAAASHRPAAAEQMEGTGREMESSGSRGRRPLTRRSGRSASTGRQTADALRRKRRAEQGIGNAERDQSLAGEGAGPARQPTVDGDQRTGPDVGVAVATETAARPAADGRERHALRAQGEAPTPRRSQRTTGGVAPSVGSHPHAERQQSEGVGRHPLRVGQSQKPKDGLDGPGPGMVNFQFI